MSVYGGSSGGGGGEAAGYGFGGPAAPAPSGGGGGSWFSPITGALGDIGHFVVDAGRGLGWAAVHDLPVETWHNVNDLYQRELDQLDAARHGDVGGFLTQGAANANAFMPGGKAGQDVGQIAQQQGSVNPFDPDVLKAYANRYPVSSGMLGSAHRTATDVEQLPRALANTLVPGHPFGNVGEVGSGAALLGKTDLAHAAARGGGGLLPKIVEDAANLSMAGKPFEVALGAGAERAAGEKAAAEAAQSSAEQAAKTAAKQASQDVQQAAKEARAAVDNAAQARQAAAGSVDPTAAAGVAQADAAAQGARDALQAAQDRAAQVSDEYGPRLDAARQAAEDAAAAHETALRHYKGMKLVNQYGMHVANSPFAIPQTALLGGDIAGHSVPGLLGLAGDALGHVPGVSSAVDAAREMHDNLQEKIAARRYVSAQRSMQEVAERDANAIIQRNYANTQAPLPTETQPVRRGPFGLFGNKQVEAQSADAQAVAIMGQTGEGAHLGNLLNTLPRDQAIAEFAKSVRSDYTPEQLELAADVFSTHGGPVSPQAEALRAAIPRVREEYAPEEARAAGDYLAMKGEDLAHVRPAVGEGVYAHAEHNVHDVTPRVEGLEQYRKLVKKAERARTAAEGRQAAAGKVLVKASEKVEGLGLSKAERANPRALFARVMKPANEVAADIIDAGPAAHEHLANATERGIAKIGRRLLAGRMGEDLAKRDLGAAIVRLATRDPAALSPQAAELVQMAGERGIGAVPRRMPDIAAALEPAERVGAGAERALIGGRQMAAAEPELERAYGAVGRAGERMAEPVRASTAGVGAVWTAVEKARQARADLEAAATRAGEKIPASVPADIPKEAIATDITEARVAGKAELQRQEAEAYSALHEAEVVPLELPPKWKDVGGPKSVYATKHPNEIAWATRPGLDAFRGLGAALDDPRFFVPYGEGGHAIDEALDRFRDGGTANDLADEVQKIRGMGATARAMSKEKGFDIKGAQMVSRKAGAHNPGFDTASGGLASEAVMAQLDHKWGIANLPPAVRTEIENAVMFGRAGHIATAIGDTLREHFGESHEYRVEPGEDVAQALARDRQLEEDRGSLTAGEREGRASLDATGKRLYDREVARSKGEVQGRIVDVKQQRAETKTAGVLGRARAQGQGEGAAMGRAEADVAHAEQAWNSGERAQQSGQAVTAKAVELTHEAAAKMATPIREMYYEAGEAEANLTEATKRYAKEQAAIESIDAKLAAEKLKLEASVEAAPRRFRPMMDLGRNLKNELEPYAQEAEKAGDMDSARMYRLLQAEAVLPLHELVRAGVDPQFIMGKGEDVGSPNMVGRRVTGLPRIGKTGFREASTGIRHATGYEELKNQALGRSQQVIRNMTGERVVAGTGGTVAEVLTDRGVPPEALEKMSASELRGHIDEAKLQPVDRQLKPLAPRDVTPHSLVIPKAIFKEFQKYEKVIPYDDWRGWALRGYDNTTMALKKALRLSPRWQMAVTMGHSIMAMTGIGADPLRYFGHDLPIALRLNKIANAGILTDADREFVAGLHPDIQAALKEHEGFLPGSERNRGFHSEEFPSTNPRRALLGERGQKFQTTLDNMHRTAVWIHQLERGLDAGGLEDFRAAYPDLAHLTDTQIQNEAAIRLSIRTMGDYLNKTTAEQKLLSRAVFFYPWLRHITKLALNTAVHNPLRVAWLLHLGAMFDPGPGPTDFLQNSYSAGLNKWLSPPSWNPFDLLSPTADNPLGSANPIINTAFAAGGYNLRTGKPVTRPSFESGSLSPMEIGNFAVNQVPLLKAASQMLPQLIGHGSPIVRYQTGQPVVSHNQFINANEDQVPGTDQNVPDWIAPLLPLLGLPRQQRLNADEVNQAAAAKAAKLAKQEAAYWRRVHAAGG